MHQSFIKEKNSFRSSKWENNDLLSSNRVKIAGNPFKVDG